MSTGIALGESGTGGEVNGGVNIGDGIGVFHSKDGSLLQFKSFLTTSSIGVSAGLNDTIRFDANFGTAPGTIAEGNKVLFKNDSNNNEYNLPVKPASSGPYTLATLADLTSGGGASFPAGTEGQILIYNSVGNVVAATPEFSVNTHNHDTLYLPLSHAASGVTTTKIGNWDTAFTWGDHASAGYLTSLPAHNHDTTYLKLSGGVLTGPLTIGTYSLPATDGLSGQVLITDGAGVVNWGSVSSGGTTYPIFSKTVNGLVPAPTGTTSTRFLREDGSWTIPVNTTYSVISDADAFNSAHTTGRLITGQRLNTWASSKGFLTTLPDHHHDTLYTPLASTGDLNALTTSNKTNLVSAINEVKSALGGVSGLTAEDIDTLAELNLILNDADLVGKGEFVTGLEISDFRVNSTSSAIFNSDGYISFNTNTVDNGIYFNVKKGGGAYFNIKDNLGVEQIIFDISSIGTYFVDLRDVKTGIEYQGITNYSEFTDNTLVHKKWVTDYLVENGGGSVVTGQDYVVTDGVFDFSTSDIVRIDTTSGAVTVTDFANLGLGTVRVIVYGAYKLDFNSTKITNKTGVDSGNGKREVYISCDNASPGNEDISINWVGAVETSSSGPAEKLVVGTAEFVPPAKPAGTYTLATSDQIAAGANPFPTDAVIAPVIHTLAGEEVNVYFENIKESGLLHITPTEVSVSDANSKNLDRSWKGNPVAGSYNAELRVRDNFFNPLKTVNFKVESLSPSINTAVNLLCIGDSITDNGRFIKYAVDKLTGITTVGLRTSQVASTPPIKAEGRSGWELTFGYNGGFGYNHFGYSYNNYFVHPANYVYYGNTEFNQRVRTTQDSLEYGYYDQALADMYDANGYKINPVTNDMIYDNSTSKFMAWSGSAWADVGNPNTWAFDFSKYVNNYPVTAPNVVSVLLGTNDFKNVTNEDFTTVYDEYVTSYRSLVDSIHAWNSNCKVLVMLPIPPGKQGKDDSAYSARRRHIMWKVYKGLIAEFNNQEAQGTYLVDLFSTLDREYAFPPATEAPFAQYTEGSSTVKHVSDVVHPHNNGYRQMAGIFAGAIQYVRNKTIGGDGGGTTDTTAPSAPQGVTVSNIQSSEATVSWTASTDN